MGIKPYLIFSLHDTRYGIPAQEVKEIFLLPELIAIAEAPKDIIGLLNLHGTYIPVMHLDLRFNHQFDRCHLTDSVIVVESFGLQVGVIVHQVETVTDIDDRYIQGDLTYGRERDIDQVFLQGVINLDDEIIVVLNVNNLIRHPDSLQSLVGQEEAEVSAIEQDFFQQYFPTVTAKNKETLVQRAVNLKTAISDRQTVESISTAVISINGNYFGLDLNLVREFSKISRITTIPCCPGHIIGNMNLRGEILTLIDIRQPLNLTINNERSLTKAVVIEVDEVIAGIVVEEVFDVLEIQPDELKAIPAATDSLTAGYFQGITHYQDRPLYFIDLPKLLTQGEMTVELAA